MFFITKLSNSAIIVLVCIISLLSCEKEPQNILSDEALTEIMSELITIENLNISDTTKVVLINNTLKEKNVSLEKLRSTIAYYKNDPEFWHLQYTQIKDRLNKNPAPPSTKSDN